MYRIPPGKSASQLQAQDFLLWKTNRNNPYPTYLGTTVDRSLTLKENTTNLASKLKTRDNIMTRGADGNSLRTFALALVFSAAE